MTKVKVKSKPSRKHHPYILHLRRCCFSNIGKGNQESEKEIHIEENTRKEDWGSKLVVKLSSMPDLNTKQTIGPSFGEVNLGVNSINVSLLGPPKNEERYKQGEYKEEQKSKDVKQYWTFGQANRNKRTRIIIRSEQI
jgi:hypothetical protein